MGLIIGLTFLGVLLTGFGVGGSRKQGGLRAGQAGARLAGLGSGHGQAEEQPVINLRKTERFSAIPWLNKKLDKIELAPRIQSLLYQAD